MEHVLSMLLLALSAGFGLSALYLFIKHWKFVLSCLLMPIAGMSAMAFIALHSQISDTTHPLLLGMAGFAVGGLLGQWLELRLNW
jgi:hypothetical protein